MEKEFECDICKKKCSELGTVETQHFKIGTCENCMEEIERFILNFGEENGN